MTPPKLALSLVAAALLGGAVSAAVVLAVQSPSEKTTQPTAEHPESAELEELRTRVKTLENNAANVRAARAMRSYMAGSAPPAAGGASGAAAAAQPPAQVVDDPVFEAAVRDVMERVQEEREADRELERDERRKRMAQRWSDELAGQLALNDAQRSKVTAIVQDFFDKLRAARDPDAGALSREQRRDRMRQLREDSERKLNEVLDRSQQQKYEQLGDEARLGGRMMGARRGRPQQGNTP